MSNFWGALHLATLAHLEATVTLRSPKQKNVLKVNFPRFFLYLCIFFCTFALAFGKRVAKNGARAIGDRYLRSIFELTKLSDGKENKKKQLVNL